ncbi:MAG: GNAT family N-acetyltransferase [Eubacteriales bacterium]
MTEFRKAKPDEADDILDFINYVFSEAHDPHDFKKYNPHMYNSDYPFWNDHYVVSENGRIRATVAITHEQPVHNGISMTACEVGQVSVHPYHRGKGYMQALMNMAVKDMQAEGVDYAHLSGLRQRYEYFGFSRAECKYELYITKNNCFHKLNYLTGVITLDNEHNILLDGQTVGHFIGDRAVLTDYSLAPGAYNAYLNKTGESEVHVGVKPYDTDCLQGLTEFCENTMLIYTDQIRIYNYEKYMLACLKPRAEHGLAADGRLSLEIDGHRLTAIVKDRKVSVEASEEADMILTHMQAQRLFFSMTEHIVRQDLPRGWFPLVL